MPFPYEEFDLKDVRTYPLSSRASKARAEDFASPYQRGSGIAGFVESLPDILAAADFTAVVAAIGAAHAAGRGICGGWART